MKKLLVALFLFCLTQHAHADDFDTIMTQTNREALPQPNTVTLTGFDLPDGYEIGSFSYTKELSSSQCFEFSVSPKENAQSKFSSDSLTKHLKKQVELRLTSAKKTPLSYTGIISQIAYRAEDGTYSITACGKISVLALRVTSKLFVDASRIDVIKDTLSEHDINYKFDLQDQYSKIEFLTRYNETDLNFVGRLIEEIGLSYTPKQINGEDTYIFVDNLATLAKYSKKIDYKALNLPEPENQKSPPALSIENRLQSDNYRMTDYDLLTDEVVSASANDKTGKNVQEEYQISDYPPSMLKKVAQVKLAALNSETNPLQIDSNNPDVDLGDQIKIGDKEYYVVLSQLYFNCAQRTSCETSNRLALIPANMRYATRIKNPHADKRVGFGWLCE